MDENKRTYIAIDLKSFYASVECSERGVDPLRTNLVVADEGRTEKTICLAVSPSLRAYGIPGRARLFEVVEQVRVINEHRRAQAPNQTLIGSSSDADELAASPQLALGYITAPPRMALYMDYSNRIYNIYLRYVASEDIHAYSVDEVFFDATPYLETYHLSARELASRMVREVESETGITATAGIGSNLYLCKIALDIEAKHAEADDYGVRVAQLDEMSYRQRLWGHRPLTDFWRLGKGYAKRLEQAGLYTMGDVARCSLGAPNDYYNEELLYQMFGVNAELLIDHAWGWEPCTIAQIKAYRPSENSISSGQVLSSPYDYAKTRLVVREMTDLLVLDLVDKRLVTDQLVLTIGYDVENLTNPAIRKAYHGEVTRDRYGRPIPKHAHGTTRLDCQTSSTRLIIDAVMRLYDRIANPLLLTRRLNITACCVVPECEAIQCSKYEQRDLFTDYNVLEEQRKAQEAELTREKHMQQAILSIKKKYGKNAIIKGMNLEEGATAIRRNSQIGGHKA